MNKMKITVFVLAAITVTLICIATFAVHDLTISEDLINEKANETFPVNGTTKLGVNYQLTNPKLELNEDGSVTVKTDGHAEFMGRTLDATVTINAIIKYVQEKGSFYLTDTKILNSEITDFQTTGKTSSKAKALAEFAFGEERMAKAKKFLSSDEGKELKDKYTLQARDIIEGKLIVKLNTTPIYTLNTDDLKQNVAKLMLKDITVDDNNLYVSFSLLQAFQLIALYVLAFIAACGIVIISLRTNSPLLILGIMSS